MGKRLNLGGNKYGRLTVVSLDKVDGCSWWKCECSCGKIVVVRAYSLVSGNTKSCGCYRDEKQLEAAVTHGEKAFGKKTSTEYSTWSDIKKRCNNPKHKQYKDYGGRGIKVCDRWLDSFENFLADMGRKPFKNYTIERINNNNNYSPENCKWADRFDQGNNTRRNLRIVYNSQEKTLSQWCIDLNLHYHRTKDRISKLKWPIELAFSLPKQTNESRIKIK